MKLIDAALISLAVGISCTSMFILSSNYPVGYAAVARPAVTAPLAARSRDFRAIVVHGPSDACRRNVPGSKDLQAHFIVHPADDSGIATVETTSRWKEQLPAAHTRNAAANRMTISIWIDAAPGVMEATPLQLTALRNLVSRLRAEYGIGRDKIYGHSEVDAGVKCGAGDIVPSLRR